MNMTQSGTVKRLRLPARR